MQWVWMNEWMNKRERERTKTNKRSKRKKKEQKIYYRRRVYIHTHLFYTIVVKFVQPIKCTAHDWELVNTARTYTSLCWLIDDDDDDDNDKWTNELMATDAFFTFCQLKRTLCTFGRSFVRSFAIVTKKNRRILYWI